MMMWVICRISLWSHGEDKGAQRSGRLCQAVLIVDYELSFSLLPSCDYRHSNLKLSRSFRTNMSCYHDLRCSCPIEPP